jgi:hypothetical protein
MLRWWVENVTRENLIVTGFLLALLLAPPFAWWLTGNPGWLWAWVVLLILGLAG